MTDTMPISPKDYKAKAEVRVTFYTGETRIEQWTGVSRRHALWEARDHYHGQARVDFANGEPA